MIVHLSDCNDDTISDFLVDRDLFVFDSFFDEEDARSKRVIMIAYLSDCDNNTISDFLVNIHLFVFDSFFDEEDAFSGW